MRILLDENMPHQLRANLPNYDISTAVYAGFGGFKNGELLKTAEGAGFDVLLTGDLSLEYQQNMAGRKIAIVSLSANNWRIVRNHLREISEALHSVKAGSFTKVNCGRQREQAS